MRAGEVCNTKLCDININHTEIEKCYPKLGTHPSIENIPNAIYVPHDRDGNKSANPRIMPIDEELRWLLLRYLLIRSDVDESSLFQSTQSFSQLWPKDINRQWKEAFHPEFAETDERKAITSHFARHWFSTYWRVTVGMNREHVQYMQGDLVQPIDTFPDSIDDYLHPKFSDIEDTYRANIYKLDVPMRHYINK